MVIYMDLLIPSPYHSLDPRVYPLPFARTMRDLVEQMKSTALGQPEIVGPTPSAIDTMQMVWVSDKALWGFVNFPEIFRYLRGSKKLQIPTIWKPLIPKRLD